MTSVPCNIIIVKLLCVQEFMRISLSLPGIKRVSELICVKVDETMMLWWLCTLPLACRRVIEFDLLTPLLQLQDVKNDVIYELAVRTVQLRRVQVMKRIKSEFLG
ncbi:hypothetical protein Droror1_Dr00025874 [Drosera rotundifolia]